MKKTKTLVLTLVLALVIVFSVIAFVGCSNDIPNYPNNDVRVSYEYNNAWFGRYTANFPPTSGDITNITRVEFRGDIVTIFYSHNNENRTVTTHISNVTLCRRQ